MAEEKERFIDRLGPTLTSGLFIALLSATSLGAVALRDMVIAFNVDIAYLKGQYDALRQESALCVKHRLESEIKIEQLKEKQEEICERIRMCDRYGSK